MPRAKRHGAGASAGDLSDPQGAVSPELRPNRAGDSCLPGHRLAAAAVGGLLRRLEAHALFAGAGHGRDLVRSSGSVSGAQLSGAAGGGDDGGPGFGGLSSRGISRSAHGLRWPLRSGAIGVPGRRQYRPGNQSVNCCRIGGDLRPALDRLVCGPGAVRHSGAVSDRHLVQAPWSAAHQRSSPCQASGAVAQQGDEVSGGPAGSDLLLVRLSVVHRQLLHILPDAQFWPVGAECPGASVLFPGCGRCGHTAWWAAGRQDRPQICDQVFRPGRAAFHPDAALRQPVLDRHPDGLHRPCAGIRLSGHRGLCSGVAARPRRHERGPDFRPFFRARRHRSGGAGCGGRRHLHHLRLQDLRLPAGDRIAGCLSSQLQGAEAMTLPPRDLAPRDLEQIAQSDLAQVERKYAVAVSPHLLSLLDPVDPDDPIARQFLPSLEELNTLPEELADPIGDTAHSPGAGIVHRHPDRVLFKAVAACPVYCRICLRRESIGPGKENALSPAGFAAALAYIAAHPQIWEVILTGGDPFILSPRRMAEISQALAAIAHVKLIRWHTRVPVTDPDRITDALVAALHAPGATTFVANQAKQPRKNAPEACAAIARLVDGCVPLVSQSVLLKGVNDRIETLDMLMRFSRKVRISMSRV